MKCVLIDVCSFVQRMKLPIDEKVYKVKDEDKYERGCEGTTHA